ncbi:GGDEF domain-containing protein [Actinotalea ferrariae]|uniref:GGDEF domain-containing protein n=1 Tax=Actinotalea ferrariae TaxID=1386098 RepID=UPI001C8CE70A|nr:GGDEF domain-containing protein [Actinotalea ferrariae]MBX9244885.1 GGDEF domain-containing protein [Actinotalea ferrariae]
MTTDTSTGPRGAGTGSDRPAGDPPSAPAAGASPGRAPAERVAKLQGHRFRMTLIGLGNAVLQSVMVFLFAWAGTTSWGVATAFAVTMLSTTAAFAVAVRTGWNLRLRDPALVVPQMASSFVIQLVYIVLAPRLWVLFLVAVLVTFTFAMVSFSPRQFSVASWAVAVGLAAAFVASRDRFGHPGTSSVDMFLIWAYFVLSIHQLTLIGSRFSSLRSQLSAKNDQLTAALARVHALATIDELTGVANRRSFMTALTEERARAERGDRPFGVAILDVDAFKQVNDVHGHGVGDAVLAELSRLAAATVRTADHFARYGGEEFALLLAAPTGGEDAVRVVERVRVAVESHDWEGVAPGLRVTLSAGVTCWRPGESAEALLARADRALYEAKATGRNRTVGVGTSTAPSSASDDGAVGEAVSTS